ncbi:tyrosine-type recombinase/integrase [Gelidibacter japonicus]|uniref:tyrosine-type recombinase/integrase n=1 Tax=Gelidibacter japonicus TaxID=1962232 RepID=UPI003A8D35E0
MYKTIKNTNAVVRYSLKESLKNLEATPTIDSLIMFHFSLKGKRFKKSTGYKCNFNQWDNDKQRIKTGKGSLENAYGVNNFLNDLQSFAELEYSEMVKSKEGINLSLLSEDIGNYIKGISTEAEIKNDSLVDYANNLQISKKKAINITTYRSNNQTINLLKRFESIHGILSFDSINMEFYRGFKGFLEEEGYSVNTIGKHIKNLKTFLNDALINGHTNNVIFKNKNFKAPKEITHEVYLDDIEISNLANLDLSNYPKMQQARDIFLIGYYTGQRVSDYNGFTENDIMDINGKKYISLNQKKTGTEVNIPLRPEIIEIRKRYDNKFPPKMSEPVLRLKIKEAARKANINTSVKKKYIKDGKKIDGIFPKYKLVKTHTARRSFCTNLYKKGKPIQEIMYFSGHKTEREFYKYIRIETQQKVVQIVDSGFFD